MNKSLGFVLRVLFGILMITVGMVIAIPALQSVFGIDDHIPGLSLWAVVLVLGGFIVLPNEFTEWLLSDRNTWIVLIVGGVVAIGLTGLDTVLASLVLWFRSLTWFQGAALLSAFVLLGSGIYIFFKR